MRQILVMFALLGGLACTISPRAAVAVEIRADQSADQALSELTLQKQYLFGSNAKPKGAKDVPIRNRTDLVKAWNPYQDWTGKTSLNSELGRYQPFGASHAFDATELTLKGFVDRSKWKGDLRVIRGSLSGDGLKIAPAAMPISNVGLTTTTGIDVGRLVAVEGRGLFRVTAVEPGKSVTVEPMAGAFWTAARRGHVDFLPVYALPLSKASAQNKGKTVLTFAGLPKSVGDGAAVGHVGAFNFTRSLDHRAVAIDRASGVVTVSPIMPAALPAGRLVVFAPPIVTGQIWSKEQLMLGSGKTYAVDFVVKVPGDGARGAWPALWLYGANNASNRGNPNVGDEIDVFEGYMDDVRGERAYSGNTLPHDRAKTLFYRDTEGWTPILGGAYRIAPTSLAGTRRFTVVVEPGQIRRYVDGKLIKLDAFQWKNPRPAQIGINLAIGNLQNSGPMNGVYPLEETNFADMTFGIVSVATYRSQ